MNGGKIVILTGASRGIGHATVQRFSDEGWRIVTCSREGIPAHCKADPNWTHHITVDLGDPAGVQEFVEQANLIIGEQPVHALVNNAAVSLKTPYKERLGILNGELEGGMLAQAGRGRAAQAQAGARRWAAQARIRQRRFRRFQRAPAQARVRARAPRRPLPRLRVPSPAQGSRVPDQARKQRRVRVG